MSIEAIASISTLLILAVIAFLIGKKAQKPIPKKLKLIHPQRERPV